MASPVKPFSRFEEHVGELKLTIEADHLQDVFIEAARFVSRECGPVKGGSGEWEAVVLSARDPATLLVDWLNELIGRSEVENRAYGDVRGLALEAEKEELRPQPEARSCPSPGDAGMDSEGGGVRLAAEVRGKPVRLWRSPLKAATYHGLELKQDAGGWRATVLLDV